MQPSLESTPIPDVKIVTPSLFRDERGHFSEVWNLRDFEAAGIGGPFVQDNQAYSAKPGTLRGMHFQSRPFDQGKLVRVVSGAILDVAVDIRHGSPTFGYHVAVTLSAANRRQLWVPAGFAHGYITLEPGTEVGYKVTNYYVRGSERGILWNDPALGIVWPLPESEIIVAQRDCQWPSLRDMEPCFVHEE